MRYRTSILCDLGRSLASEQIKWNDENEQARRAASIKKDAFRKSRQSDRSYLENEQTSSSEEHYSVQRQ